MSVTLRLPDCLHSAFTRLPALFAALLECARIGARSEIFMPAYLIVDTKIKDAEAYEDYKSKAKPIAEKYGGQYRARGGELDIIESDLWSPTRLVIIEFPDMDSARKFADSEEYRPVKAIRNANADCTVVLLDGA